MTEQHVYHHSDTVGDKLKVEVTENSRGYNVSVRLYGSDEQEVIDTVARVMKAMKAKLEEE